MKTVRYGHSNSMIYCLSSQQPWQEMMQVGGRYLLLIIHVNCIVAKCPGMAGTVLEFMPMSQSTQYSTYNYPAIFMNFTNLELGAAA